MARIIISPSTVAAVDILYSQTASIMSALIRRRRKGMGDTATFSVPSLGSEVATVAGASTILQSQLMSLIAVARKACVIAVRK